MASLRKLIICPYFGPFPEWMDLFLADFEKTMKPAGYDLLIDTDIEEFKKRVIKRLGIEYPGTYGNPKPWDYRCALGLLYQEELEEYDYWAHADFDVVFGRVEEFLPDSEISKWDVFSNHHSYVNGCFSLYRNHISVNYLFMRHPQWREFLIHPEPNGWIETDYSRLLESSGLKYRYAFYQGWPYTTSPSLAITPDGRLYQDGEEIMMFHFRRSKKWPL